MGIHRIGRSQLGAARRSQLGALTSGLCEFLRPDEDLVNTVWSDEGGGTTDIYKSMDEVNADDTD